MNNPHSVVNRIVRRKAKSPVEFGAKLDLSVDRTGICRFEKLPFDAYNRSAFLKTAIACYKNRTSIIRSVFWLIKSTAIVNIILTVGISASSFPERNS